MMTLPFRFIAFVNSLFFKIVDDSRTAMYLSEVILNVLLTLLKINPAENLRKIIHQFLRLVAGDFLRGETLPTGDLQIILHVPTHPTLRAQKVVRASRD